jgi:signal transduction histidine kinase
VDEAIVLRKKEFETNNQQTLHITDIAVWNKFNRDIRILPDTVVSKPKDSIIQQTFYDALIPEWEPYRVLYTNVKIGGQPFVLMIQLNLVESEDLIKTIIWIYLGILFALLLVIFFITRFISNRLWQPFYDTLKRIDQFNIEQHSSPEFSVTNVKEFEHLNVGLEKLIQGNLQSYASQKSFTQNAAHELQTPLAIFQSKLDLLLQDTSLTQPQATIVQSLYEATSRLTRINKNLLLLAKIENNQFAETITFTINELINDVVPYFTEQANSKQLVIEKNIETVIDVNVNRGLAEIMINNLFLNAVRHNVENGKILVSLKDNRFTIANSGTTQPLDETILFKRFGKGSADVRSSGLGLAIVKEICDRYGWQVSYKFEDGLHFFSVSF